MSENCIETVIKVDLSKCDMVNLDNIPTISFVQWLNKLNAFAIYVVMEILVYF